jgi:hypothetical protein
MKKKFDFNRDLTLMAECLFALLLVPMVYMVVRYNIVIIHAVFTTMVIYVLTMLIYVLNMLPEAKWIGWLYFILVHYYLDQRRINIMNQYELDELGTCDDSL